MAQPGERVWIRHSTEVWEPAVVDAVDGLRVQVHAVGGALMPRRIDAPLGGGDLL